MSGARSTDWGAYYRRRSSWITRYTRKIITRFFLSRLIRYQPSKKEMIIAELGAYRSLFYSPITQQFPLSQYHVVDNHHPDNPNLGKDLVYHHKSILDLEKGYLEADVVLSVGLIEHFGEKTLEAIDAHFKIAKPGGIVIISFPTPTLTYKITRYFLEITGAWIFHDEVPLTIEDVRNKASAYGNILETQRLWALPLTQAVIVFQVKI